MSEIRLVSEEGADFDFPDEMAVRGVPFGRRANEWRALTAAEIAALEVRGNRADDWGGVTVLDGFDPSRVNLCVFRGRVRIGVLSRSYLEFHDIRLPVGLSSSTIVSCDIGDNVAVHNVAYLAHMVVSERCTLFNVDEIVTTDHAKFGNGVVMDGEDEAVRIWLEIANENGGRRVLPFDGMLPADAWIWSKYRSDQALMDRFVAMTARVKSPRRGTFGVIGAETVIKDCRILKDVRVGESAYIKGCNKLKNLTINSDARRPTQLGEGCELVNGIIGYDCRIFYGVKAVRFILCDHSNLKYGARLINSILGSNSTISCCEVLNSLIFGSHEQHHNSSFLCASVFKGQSNMASAATVGSNHNSRAPDGEIVADRGFWPGLSVSLKHNSRFAAFTLISKGAYPAEMDIPLPFSLVANDESRGELVLMPGYWFRYNMYALARNAAKTAARDKRLVRHQELEYDWLAPDTVDQMRAGRRILEGWADEMYPNGRAALESGDSPELYAGDSFKVESGRRRTRILYAGRAWRDYGRMIRFYAVRTILKAGKPLWLPEDEEKGPEAGGPLSGSWENVGGQLMLRGQLEDLKDRVKSGIIGDWDALHRQYRLIDGKSAALRLAHARAVLTEQRENPALAGKPGKPGKPAKADRESIAEAVETAAFILRGIEESRRKDYDNHFRNVTYDSVGERDAVMGPYGENEFILDARKDFEAFRILAEAALIS